jgi:hypothetical protein
LETVNESIVRKTTTAVHYRFLAPQRKTFDCQQPFVKEFEQANEFSTNLNSFVDDVQLKQQKGLVLADE